MATQVAETPRVRRIVSFAAHPYNWFFHQVQVMVELLRTNDLVLISAVEALLRDAGVYFFIADQNMSVTEGSLGFLPRRIWVPEDQAEEARRLLREAGFADELPES